MISLLRQPDAVYGATEKKPFRFEEMLINEVKYSYEISDKSVKIHVYPSGSPVKYLKLRFNGDLRSIDRVYDDQWERAGLYAYIEWRSVMACCVLPWFCYVMSGNDMFYYGVKTGANCFAFFQVDTGGITLFLNLCSGAKGTDISEPLLACEIVEMRAEKVADVYKVATGFSKKMCDSPVLPKTPIFGVNNWYWAYGDISYESVLKETDYLLEMTNG